MYMVAEFKNGKVNWTDGRIYDNKLKATNRLEFVKKHSKRTNLQIIKFTKFSVYNPAS